MGSRWARAVGWIRDINCPSGLELNLNQCRAAARARKAAQRKRDDALLAPYGWRNWDELRAAVRARLVVPPAKPASVKKGITMIAIGDKVKIKVGGYAGEIATVTDIKTRLDDGEQLLTLYTQSSLTLWYYKPNQVERISNYVER